jgi:cytochrome c-type biogenesis protein CcmE
VRRHLKFVVPTGLLVVALVGVLVMLNSSLVYFRTPTEVRQGVVTASDQRFRLGGQVERGTVVGVDDGVVRFAVTDGRAEVPVVFTGAPQQLFREGIGVVVEGTWDGTEFRSDTMMIKHDEQYRTEDGRVYDDGSYELVTEDAGP